MALNDYKYPDISVKQLHTRQLYNLYNVNTLKRAWNNKRSL